MATQMTPTAEANLQFAGQARFSRVLAFVCALAAVGAVAMALLTVPLMWLRSDVTGWSRIAFLTGWIVAIGFLVWGLGNGRASFAGLSRGELFARRTIAGLRNLALGILVFKTASYALAVGAAIVTSETLRSSGVNITFGDLAEGAFTLISLGAIVLIASVLTRAAEIAEDNAQIV